MRIPWGLARRPIIKNSLTGPTTMTNHSKPKANGVPSADPRLLPDAVLAAGA